jgi:3-hydroxyisobutyrate dehydrogenase-like beta-hydroxyacid dehydrogenase
MCKNLVEKGSLSKPLIIYNRTSQRATDLSNKLPKGRSTVAETIEDAVSKSDIIFTCVGDDKAMEATIDTAKTVDIKGKLFVDCSTIHPDTTDKLAKIIEGAGAEFVACPGIGAIALSGV